MSTYQMRAPADRERALFADASSASDAVVVTP